MKKKKNYFIYFFKINQILKIKKVILNVKKKLFYFFEKNFKNFLLFID